MFPTLSKLSVLLKDLTKTRVYKPSQLSKFLLRITLMQRTVYQMVLIFLDTTTLVSSEESVRCFNCQQFGHIAKSCLNPSRCSQCDKWHFQIILFFCHLSSHLIVLIVEDHTEQTVNSVLNTPLS